jgi:adenylate cyclase
MFADMADYTALMHENEQLATAKRHRLKEVLEANVEAHNGRILQYYGDGSLSIFNSAIDSVNSAIAIQKILQQDPKVDLRIGIHTGDVAMEDGAIYGDGVNLASRIESLAVPGSIFISEKMVDELKNHQQISTRELGYFELKNIKQPVKVFAVANKGLVVPARDELKGKTKPPANRLAVLPFVNMSADPENEYFSDGITEELLNALTKVDGLQVTSRTSAFAFKNQRDDIRDIALKLNVDKVLEGSVRKAGSRVRITAQLINAADGYHIWSENYDRDLTDIFQVQDEISGIIANRLRENLTLSKKKETLVKTGTKNVAAYTQYLKGLHYWNKMTPGDVRKAIECFEQAINEEPDYAQAYAMIAACHSRLGSTGQISPRKAFEIVHRYADKALQLDDTLAEGYAVKGSAYLFFEWKWEEGYKALQKALQLNPAHMNTYQLLAFYYIIVRKKEEAVKIMEEAVQMDPLSAAMNHYLGEMYVFSERYDDAIRQADKVLEMNPQMRTTLEMKGWAIGQKGDWEAALEIFKEVHRLTGHPLKGLMGVCFSYGKLGRIDEAMACIHKMEQRQREEPEAVIDADLAAGWLGVGDFDKTFYYLNQAADKRMAPIAFFIEYPALKSLKADPRYRQLREKENISPQSI